MKTANPLPLIGSFRATSLDSIDLHDILIQASPGVGLVQIGPYMVQGDQIDELTRSLQFARSIAMQEFLRPAEFRSAATQDLHVAIDGLHSEIAEAGDDWLDLASALRGELEEQGNRVAVQLRKMRALIKRIEAEQQEQRWRLVLLTHDVQRLGRSVGVAVSEPEVRS